MIGCRLLTVANQGFRQRLRRLISFSFEIMVFDRAEGRRYFPRKQYGGMFGAEELEWPLSVIQLWSMWCDRV